VRTSFASFDAWFRPVTGSLCSNHTVAIHCTAICSPLLTFFRPRHTTHPTMLREPAWAERVVAQLSETKAFVAAGLSLDHGFAPYLGTGTVTSTRCCGEVKTWLCPNSRDDTPCPSLSTLPATSSPRVNGRLGLPGEPAPAPVDEIEGGDARRASIKTLRSCPSAGRGRAPDRHEPRRAPAAIANSRTQRLRRPLRPGLGA
jgi:hypothetical protein